MNAEQHIQEPAGLPVGFVLPGDHQQQPEAIERAIEEQAMQMRAAAFIATLDTRQRELFAAPCPVS